MIGPRLLGAAAVTCFATFGLALLGTHPAYADDGMIHYQQYNLYGWLGHQGGLAPSNRVDAHVEFRSDGGHPPVGLSLQEVCKGAAGSTSQANDLVNDLDGYVVIFAPTSYFEDRPTCTQFGIAVGLAGSYSNEVHNSKTLVPNGGPAQKVVCVHAYFYAWNNACSTHLDPDQKSVAQQQAQDATVWVTNFGSNYPGYYEYFGGDFNLRPYWFLSANNPYSGRDEADETYNRKTADTNQQGPPITGPTVSGPNGTEVGIKIDYGFAKVASLTEHEATLWFTSESDHVLLEAHFQPK